MDRTTLTVVFCVLLTLIFGACVAPVGLNEFLEDEKVQEIVIRDNTRLIIDFNVEPFDDKTPELGMASGPLKEGDIITLSVSGNDFPFSVTLRIADPEIYETGTIDWYIGNPDFPLTASGTYGEVFVARTSNSPFNTVGFYHLVIEAWADEVIYSTYILIHVVG
jgi:hypothetical protein